MVSKRGNSRPIDMRGHLPALGLCLILVGAGGAAESSHDAPLVQILRPAALDFVEVVRGGEMATELVRRLPVRDGRVTRRVFACIETPVRA